MTWTDATVRQALGWSAGDESVRYSSISTDTRTLTPGSLFVALAGERFDGHAFLEAARARGARAAVVRRGTSATAGLHSYEVDDPLQAYGWLARRRRRTCSGPVVAVTGTNGKTSTKELVAAALRTRFATHATRANLNNLVGVPQTILDAPDGTEAMVIEAGASEPGEIARCRAIIEPTIAVITNVGAAHLDGFGSLEGVLREKLELARGVPVAVVGTAPADLAARGRAVAGRVVTAGVGPAEFAPASLDLTADGRPVVTVDGRRFTLGLRGRHQAANAMLAWAVARVLDLDLDRVAAALEGCRVPGGRGELREVGGLGILDDSYNANPASFAATIRLAAELRRGRPLVFVAGTMRELGPDSPALHRDVARQLVELDPDLLAAVGEFGPALEAHRDRLGDRLLVAPDAEAMGRLLAPRLRGNELVVLKASRGVALERLIPFLDARAGATA
jgi:UDP-N-acetylmuramoyl-tripeptide--D-alanyl-D-alanine ligase